MSILLMWSVRSVKNFQSDSYELMYDLQGDTLVVEDLTDASYAYAEDLDSYEVRKKGVRLGRFDSFDAVESFLEDEVL